MREYCVQFHAYCFKNTNKRIILTYELPKATQAERDTPSK